MSKSFNSLREAKEDFVSQESLFNELMREFPTSLFHLVCAATPSLDLSSFFPLYCSCSLLLLLIYSVSMDHLHGLTISLLFKCLMGHYVPASQTSGVNALPVPNGTKSSRLPLLLLFTYYLE